MSTDKLLQKIKIRIGAISESMQVFAEETIHPTVADCDLLRDQMNDLLEQLAVYKHHMQNAELSPSFHLHAKVSEKIVDVTPEPEPPIVPPTSPEPVTIKTTVPEPPPIAPIAAPREEKKAEVTPPEPSPAPEKLLQRPALSIGLNDKFRFINELFAQNSSEYNIAIEQLNSMQQWNETELYLNSLKSVYGWKESNESVKYFFTLIRKRFDA
jgi:hypothetical protein